MLRNFQNKTVKIMRDERNYYQVEKEECMKKKTCYWLVTVIFLACALCGCDGGWPKCIPPSAGFSEIDLVGTWLAGLPERSDTLIIKPDGTYRQVVHIGPNRDYISSWRRWWLDDKNQPFPYLYLEGMSLCGFEPGFSCNQAGSGGFDYCKNTSIPMENGVVLMILSNQKPWFSFSIDQMPQSDIYFLYPSLDDSWSYFFQP
jgi:hypothetical protein